MGLVQEELLAAQARIDEEHRELAALMIAVGGVCSQSRELVVSCTNCSPEVRQACWADLSAIGRRLTTLMLDHFLREESVMSDLPDNHLIRTHCDGHRASHVSFVGLYNDAVAKLDASNVVLSAQRLELVVTQWVREHAMSFDAEFSALVGRPVRGE